MSKRLLTIDDAMSTLSHSSLPSLVVEGGSDVVVLRRLEQLVSEAEISVLPVGGKDTVLGVFNRREELGNEACVLFFVDQDLWIYSTVPDEYQHGDLLATSGYSIENDMFVDGQLERLLTVAERTSFVSELDHFLDWFSNQLRVRLDGQEAELSSHPNQVLEQARPEVTDVALRESLATSYAILVRGRSLFAIILRQLSRPNRSSKYSYENLLELGAIASGPNLVRVRDWISARLVAHDCV